MPPPLTLSLPENDKARQIVVRPASLAGYDRIHESDMTTDEEQTDDSTD